MRARNDRNGGGGPDRLAAEARRHRLFGTSGADHLVGDADVLR
jgi:hypothetical protein